MIKLTPVDGEPMYVKADAIIAFWWLGDRTEVRMPGDFGFDVKETPEQILELMRLSHQNEMVKIADLVTRNSKNEG